MSAEVLRRALEELAPRFRALRYLARGSQGVVVLAQQEELGREVVLKLLRTDLGAVDGEAGRRFQREAELLRDLRSPHLVSLIDFGLVGETAYMASEYLPGQDLATVLREQGRLSAQEVRTLLHDVLLGLTEAHEAGVVHRDLKPANLLRVPGRGYLVIDFGIAIREQSLTRLTEEGHFLGTPNYAAPGQVEGRGADPRDDLYSLGVIAYEALTGANPFRRESVHQSLLAHLECSPPPLRERLPLCLPELAQLVDLMLEKERADRPRDARSALALLEGEEPGRSSGGSGAPLSLSRSGIFTFTSFLAPLLERDPDLASGVGSERSRTGRPYWVLPLGLALLLAGGAGVWLQWGRGAGSSPSPGLGGAGEMARVPGTSPQQSPALGLDLVRLPRIYRDLEEAWLVVLEQEHRDPFAWERALDRVPGARELARRAASREAETWGQEAWRTRARECEADLVALGAPELLGPLLDPREPTHWLDSARRAEVEALALQVELDQALEKRQGVPASLSSPVVLDLLVRGRRGAPTRNLLPVCGHSPSSRGDLESWLRPLGRAARRMFLGLGRAAARGEEGVGEECIDLVLGERDWAPALLGSWARATPEVVLGGSSERFAWKVLAQWLAQEGARVRGYGGQDVSELRERLRERGGRLLEERRGARPGDLLRGVLLSLVTGLDLELGDPQAARDRFRQQGGSLEGLPPRLRLRLDLRWMGAAGWPEDSGNPLVRELRERWRPGFPPGAPLYHQERLGKLLGSSRE